jgi:type 1 fimbria pilin
MNATVPSPISISAGATAPSGYLAAIRIYVDNVAQTLVNNPQTSQSLTINQPLTLTTGSHYLVIVGYPSTGGSVSASATITVQ